MKLLQSEIERLCRRGMGEYRNMSSNMWGTKNNTGLLSETINFGRVWATLGVVLCTFW
jgi:hypothetical protein